MPIPTLAATIDYANAATTAAAVGAILWSFLETPPRRICWLVAAACAIVAALGWTQPDHTNVGSFVLLGMGMAFLATSSPQDQEPSETKVKDNNAS